MKPSAQQPDSFHDSLETIGVKLKSLRVNKGYESLSDFAADHNLPPIQYWRMEKGRANMTVKSLHRVLEIHGLSLGDFFSKPIVRRTPTGDSDRYKD